MRRLLLIPVFFLSLVSVMGQESYFDCDALGVRPVFGGIHIRIPVMSKEAIGQRLMSFIRENHFEYKPFYSTDRVIVFRDFSFIGKKDVCGADIIAKNIFFLSYDSGIVNVRVDPEIFSSIHGAELVINKNDDVASKNDVPFGHYEFQVAKQYVDVYPEAIYSFDKRGNLKLERPEVRAMILDYYNRYIIYLKSYFEGNED